MRKYSIYIFVAFFVSIIVFWFYLNREKGNPKENFEAFFKTFEESYALFEVKNIEWRDLYSQYSEKVNKNTPDDELFNVFQEILFKLDDKHCYIYRLRSLDNIYSYQEPEYWTIEPCLGKNFSNRPVALLINENTQSAAELFTLMMKTLPNVTLIGDTTSGVFADTHIGKLPNGWEYRMSVRKTTNCNDNSLEDIGIVPDILIENTKKDIDDGKDKVIEYSIKYLPSRNK